MAIQRWEMLLSAQADCYLLKIQGDRVDVDRILLSHPQSCRSAQEISGDIFQWVIFVVDAPLSERLSIQNQVMSLTNNTTGEKPSEALMEILDGLSNALQDLTNLTDEEQAFVMNKMARMGTPPPPPPSTTTAPPAPGRPLPPAGTYPPAGTPLPRVTIPGRPGPPMPSPFPGNPAAGPGPVFPGKPGAGTPLPSPGPIPNIIRPVMPPRSFPGVPQDAPKKPGSPLPNPMPSIPMPKITLPSPPVAAPTPIPPAAPPLPPIPVPQKPEGNPLFGETQNSRPAPSIESMEKSKKIDVIGSVLSDLNMDPKKSNDSPSLIEPPTSAPPPRELKEPAPPPTPPAEPKEPDPPLSLPAELKEIAPPPSLPAELKELAPSPAELKEPAPPRGPEPIPPLVKTDDSGVLRLSIFYTTGQESVMNQFLSTLTEVAQKKSKRPTAFQVALSVPTEVSLENSTEWIWKAKTSGSDIFFVILPEGMGAEIMDPLVGEALSAGLRCFIVPQIEVSSKLLYMDLMVELMMFKRRIRPPSP